MSPQTPTPQPQKPKQLKLELPNDLKAVYANLAFIANTPAELVLDFAQVLPRTPRARIVSRVILSPMHAKLLLQALSQNVRNYEQQFGEIQIPRRTNIADDFFRYMQEGGDDETE